MADTNELIVKMNEMLSSFSKGQKKIANYIMLHYDKAAFFTAAKLGEAVGVSESTVVRFASVIGYSGYPELQKAIESLVRDKLNSIDKIELNSKNLTRSELFEKVLMSDVEKINLTLETLDRDAFEEAIESILNARRIYVVGIRSCAPLANFLGFYLNLMFDEVVQVTTNNSSEIFEQMLRMNEEDVIVGISFPRYSMRTLKAMEFANNRNAKVITITDNKNSPMNLYSSCNLLARSDMISVIDSLVAPLSVINALIVALCMKKQDKVVNTLEELENIWEEYQVYGADEINYASDSVKMKDVMENSENE